MCSGSLLGQRTVVFHLLDLCLLVTSQAAGRLAANSSFELTGGEHFTPRAQLEALQVLHYCTVDAVSV